VLRTNPFFPEGLILGDLCQHNINQLSICTVILLYHLRILYNQLVSSSSIRCIRSDSSSQLRLPLIAIRKQLLFVVEQFLSRFRRVLGVGRLDDCVDRARLLAHAAVDALGHVDVIARRPSRAVRSLLGLDCYCLGGTDLK
jgi:hypothetical protein